MRTARTLGAEWKQDLRESGSTVAKEDESSTGRVWAAGFHHVLGERFETYETFISLIFKNFSDRGKRRILNR
jgi:hypothetical protein